MNKIAFLLTSAVTVLVATGCNDDKPAAAEEIQSVEWYKDHKAERERTVENCRKLAAAQIGGDPNCMNAMHARDSVSLGAKRLQLAPLTKEQLKAGGFGAKETQGGASK